MPIRSTLFLITLSILICLYISMTDRKLEQLDKRIQNIEMRIAIAEHKLNIVPHRT